MRPLVFPSLFKRTTIAAIAGALDPAAMCQGAIAVLGDARIGRGLEQRGYRVVLVGDRPRSTRRTSALPTYERLDQLPRDQALAGLVGADIGQRDDWDEALAGWIAAVTGGGAIVLVDRAPAADMTRRALCSGLVDIGQRQAGRTIVTSGRVTRF